MKILMVLESEFPGDIRVENEINELSEHQHKIDIACLSKSRTYKEKDDYNNSTKIFREYISEFMIKMGALSLSLPFYNQFWNKFLIRILRENSYDAIYIHDLPLASVGYKLAKKSHLKFYLDLHENRPEIMKLYRHVNSGLGKYLISTDKWEHYQSKIVKKADKLVLTSQEACEYYHQKYGVEKEKTFSLPNVANLAELKEFSVERSQGKFILNYFGDTGLRRGTSTIIEAANLLKSYEDIFFYIIGDSKEQHNLEKLIEKYNLKNVKLTGWLSLEKGLELIAKSDIGLCPFLRNLHHDMTFANKMFINMFYGKPVIVSDCVAQANFVKLNKCGEVFEAENTNDLVEKILNVRNDKSLYESYSNKARELVKNQYNWKSFGVLYHNFLIKKKVLKKRTPDI